MAGRKFGKKKHVNLNPLSYNIALLGESGIGKSTLIKEVCEKLVGEDGYIALDIGKEAGHDAIEGIISETTPDWESFCEVIDDIVENKNTDYKDLQVIVIDTYDELCSIAEKEAIRLYNRKRKDGAPKVDTINAAWGGFGKGLDKTIDLMLDKLWEIKHAGMGFIIIAHTKKKDIEDTMSEEAYSVLTSNVSQKYFNALKSKLHFVGMAYIDREVVKAATAKKDSKGNTIYRSKIAGESRVINFRDDTYSTDSKSRFADVVAGKIPFNPDEFIKALTDAIEAERSKSGETKEKSEERQKQREEERAVKADEFIEKTKIEHSIDEEKNEEILEDIRASWAGVSKEVKNTAKDYMKEHGFSSFKAEGIPTPILEHVLEILTAE